MAFEVTLYEFKKRHNSTRRPSGDSVPFNGTLREGSSLITPTIAFEFYSDASPMSNSWNLHFNYAYIAKFARYYWITDWTYDGGLWHAAMKVDVLATYRPQILSADAFIAYDETHPNTDLVDSRLSMLTAKSFDSEIGMFSKLGQNDTSGGVVVVMCTGKNSTAAFAMEPSQITQLMNNVVSWASAAIPETSPQYPGSSSDTYAEALWNSVREIGRIERRNILNLGANGNAAENLRAAVQLPIAIADVPGTSQQVILGQYETNIYAKKVSSRVLYDTANVRIPWRANGWRMNEPYTEIYLYIPYVGNIKMPNGILIGETHLKILAVVDLLSGDAIFRVYVEPTDKLIASYSVNIGASYPIGASNVSPGQVVTGIAGAVGSIAAGVAKGGVAGAAIGALGAIQGIMAANTPNSSSIGGGGGGATQGLLGVCSVSVITHDVNMGQGAEDTAAIMGTPTMCVRPLAGVEGYLETRGAAITGNMTATEHAELNAMLDSGIYVELGG